MDNDHLIRARGVSDDISIARVAAFRCPGTCFCSVKSHYDQHAKLSALDDDVLEERQKVDSHLDDALIGYERQRAQIPRRI